MNKSEAVTRPTLLEWVHQAFRRRMVADVEVEDYLVFLLEGYLRQDAPASAVLSKPLLMGLFRSFAKSGNARTAQVRQIGDASLFTAGILGPHLDRSLVGMRHYVEVGQSAYGILYADLGQKDKLKTVYGRFAHDLGPFVAVLNEVSAEHIFPADLESIMFVFNRYRATKSEEDCRWLLQHGVVFIDGPDSKGLIL